MHRKNFPGRKDQKRAEAQVRQDYYDTLTLEEMLELARQAPGESKKQIAKLEKKIAQRKKDEQ